MVTGTQRKRERWSCCPWLPLLRSNAELGFEYGAASAADGDNHVVPWGLAGLTAAVFAASSLAK
jgi:hypothetical protein